MQQGVNLSGDAYQFTTSALGGFGQSLTLAGTGLTPLAYGLVAGPGGAIGGFANGVTLFDLNRPTSFQNLFSPSHADINYDKHQIAFCVNAFASFLLALGCAIPFGIDLWNNIHTASFGGALSAALKYRGAVECWLALLCLFYFCCYTRQKRLILWQNGKVK